MTYPFVYFGAGGAEQCGGVGPSNYLANGPYANNMKSVFGDASTRSMIFLKRQTEGNKEKFTLFASFRRATLARESVSDKHCLIIGPEAETEFSASAYLSLNNDDKLTVHNIWDDGTVVSYKSDVKLVDTDGFYNVIVSLDGKNNCNMWINGKLVSVTRSVVNITAGRAATVPRWNDSRYDICVGGLKGLKRPSNEAVAVNPEWAFRGEMCIAGMIDGVYVETPNLFGFVDDRTDEWVPSIPDMTKTLGNSFCLVGRDYVVKDAMRTYITGGKPNEMNMISPNSDPIGMVLQSSYEAVADNPDIYTPLFGNDVSLSLHGFRRTAKATWSADKRQLTQTAPYGLQANGNTNSLVHSDGHAGSIVFPNSPDKGMQFLKYTGTGADLAIPHNLGKKPDAIVVVKVGAAQVGHSGTPEHPYIWVRDGGNENMHAGVLANVMNEPVYYGNTGNAQLLSQKTDASNIHLRAWVDPATLPDNQVRTINGSGRHHDSKIFTIGAVTYMALAEYSDKSTGNDQTGGGVYLYKVENNNTLTQLDYKAHTRSVFVQYFALGGDHYIILCQNSTQPTVNAHYGKATIYQINTATNKLGTKWETADLRSFNRADIFVDGSKLVITVPTNGLGVYTDANKSHCYDFDETNGFHNKRDVSILDGRTIFQSFVVGSERYAVSFEGVVGSNTFNQPSATGLYRMKVCKWQTGSRTWGDFIDSMEFVQPLRAEWPTVFTHNGRIYLYFAGSAQRFTMFDEKEKRGVYLYEFEIAKMRFKLLDFIHQNGAWVSTSFVKDGKAYLATSAREHYLDASLVYKVAAVLYRLSDDGNHLINVNVWSGRDSAVLSTGTHANGDFIGCVTNLGNIQDTVYTPNASYMVKWDADAGYFTGKQDNVNFINKAGVDYFVMAFSNSDNVVVDRVHSAAFRTFIPAMTKMFEDDGERYFVISTQLGNIAPSGTGGVGYGHTDADYEAYGKVLTYQYVKHRGTVIPVHELRGLNPDSNTQIFERNGDRYMVVSGVGKDWANVSTVDRFPKMYVWNKAKRIWDLKQSFPGQGSPMKPGEHSGSLYLGFINLVYGSTFNHYPALWKFNDTSKVFELLTANRTDQKHLGMGGAVFSKNGKLWAVFTGLWVPFNVVTNYILLFEVNPANGLFTLVQNIEHDGTAVDTVRKYCEVHDVDGEVILSVSCDLNTSNKRFGLYRFDNATSRMVKDYEQLTVDNSANPIVNYIKYDGKHLFFFPAYQGNNTVTTRAGATTVLEYLPVDKTAIVRTTQYSAGLIQVLPFEEDGRLRTLNTFYWDVARNDFNTSKGIYSNTHSYFDFFDTETNRFLGAWGNNTKQTDFNMWLHNKEESFWKGPEYYYDISNGRYRQHYLYQGTPLTGGLGTISSEGGWIGPLFLPESQSRGYGLFISSDKWVAGMERDIRTGNQFLVQPLHSGGLLTTTANPYNPVVSFTDNIKSAGKEKLKFGVANAGMTLHAVSGQTAFTSTAYVIPGWGSSQKDPLQLEVTLTIMNTGHFAFGFATYADRAYANAPMRMVSPLAGSTGLVHNPWDLKSGDTVQFVLNYQTRKITGYINGGGAIAKDMPEDSMCFFMDQYEAAGPTGLWAWANFGQKRFEYPLGGGKALTAENLKQAYPVVRSKKFFAEGTTGFNTSNVEKNKAFGDSVANADIKAVRNLTKYDSVPVSVDLYISATLADMVLTRNDGTRWDTSKDVVIKLAPHDDILKRFADGRVTLNGVLQSDYYIVGFDNSTRMTISKMPNYITGIHGVIDDGVNAYGLSFKKIPSFLDGDFNSIQTYSLNFSGIIDGNQVKINVGTFNSTTKTFTLTSEALKEKYLLVTSSENPDPTNNFMISTNISTSQGLSGRWEFTWKVAGASAAVGDAVPVKTEFSPDMVLIWDEGHKRKHRWFYRGWGDNNFYSGQDFNGALGTVLNSGISGFVWNDDGFSIRKTIDAAWGSNDKIHYHSWEQAKCSGMEIVEYVGNASPVVLNLNNIEGTPDAVIILSKDDAANRANVIDRSMDNPGRNYKALHTSSPIQLNTSTIVTFESKKLTIPNAAGYNQAGKNYIAIVFKSVPGFSHFGVTKTTGELEAWNAMVGITPSCTFTTQTTVGDAFSVRHRASGDFNPAPIYYMHNSTPQNAAGNATLEFLSTGVKGNALFGANTVIYCMMWGSPWVYSQGR